MPPPRELLENASAVIGYNSTTLVESLAMGCRTIVPVFSDLLEDDSWEMFASHGTLVEQWQKPGSLAELLAEGGDGSRYDGLLDAFLARTMYRRDGQASRRVEAVLSDAMKNMRKQEAS